MYTHNKAYIIQKSRSTCCLLLKNPYDSSLRYLYVSFYCEYQINFFDIGLINIEYHISLFFKIIRNYFILQYNHTNVVGYLFTISFFHLSNNYIRYSKVLFSAVKWHSLVLSIFFSFKRLGTLGSFPCNVRTLNVTFNFCCTYLVFIVYSSLCRIVMWHSFTLRGNLKHKIEKK